MKTAKRATKLYVGRCRRDYLCASTKLMEINREIDGHLKALHLANCKRETLRPKYDQAKKAIDRALRQQRKRKARR